MSIYTSEIMEAVAMACGIPKRYDLSRRSHSAPTIAVSGAAFGHGHAADPPRLWISMSRRCIGISDFPLHFRGSLVFRF